MQSVAEGGQAVAEFPSTGVRLSPWFPTFLHIGLQLQGSIDTQDDFYFYTGTTSQAKDVDCALVWDESSQVRDHRSSHRMLQGAQRASFALDIRVARPLKLYQVHQSQQKAAQARRAHSAYHSPGHHRSQTAERVQNAESAQFTTSGEHVRLSFF